MIVPSVVDDDSSLPRYALPGDAGADLRCREHVILRPGERRLVPTGVRVAIPDGHVGFVNPRSGLAIRTGLSIVNAPGTIDSGYRGDIRVGLVNLDQHEPIELQVGDRVAQLVIVPFVHAQFVRVDELDDTERGQGGHGSTGRG